MDPFNPQSPLAQQRSVYFDFDSYTVPDQYRSLVEMHSSYLTSHGQQKIRIEGNADARGGSEYNLALGQRRSDAVSRMMTLLGVNRSEEHTSELQSLMRISYAVFCLKKKNPHEKNTTN